MQDDEVMSQSAALEAALEAVATLDSLGLTVVPWTPSPVMLQAGVAVCGLPQEVVARVYRAMLEQAE